MPGYASISTPLLAAWTSLDGDDDDDDDHDDDDKVYDNDDDDDDDDCHSHKIQAGLPLLPSAPASQEGSSSHSCAEGAPRLPMQPHTHTPRASNLLT
jgi:hypothetical protein